MEDLFNPLIKGLFTLLMEYHVSPRMGYLAGAVIFGLIVLAGIGAIALGAKGFRQTGMPLSKQKRIMGGTAKAIGVVCIVIGLFLTFAAIFGGATFVAHMSEEARGREALVRLEQSFGPVIGETGPDSDDDLHSWRSSLDEIKQSEWTPPDVLAWAKAWAEHVEASEALVKKFDALEREIERNRQEAERQRKGGLGQSPWERGPFYRIQPEAIQDRSRRLYGESELLVRQLKPILAARRELLLELDELRETYGWEPRPSVMDAIARGIADAER
jgi:hypothetical protein